MKERYQGKDASKEGRWKEEKKMTCVTTTCSSFPFPSPKLGRHKRKDGRAEGTKDERTEIGCEK